MSRRRNLLAGAAALAGTPEPRPVAIGAATLPAHAFALVMGPNDVLLQGHDRRAQRHAQAEETTCRAKNRARTAATRDRHAAAQERAWEAWCGVMRQVAAIPADGLGGVAVKARMVLKAMQDGGGTAVDDEVAASLAADLARLIPEWRA